MTKELSEGRAVIIRGKRYVCTEIFDEFADTDEIIVIHLRKINAMEAAE